MENRDTIEFYHGKNFIAACRSSIVPAKGSGVSIKKKAWYVEGISYSVDYSDDPTTCRMRCNVYVITPQEYTNRE